MAEELFGAPDEFKDKLEQEARLYAEEEEVISELNINDTREESNHNNSELSEESYET